MTIRQGTFEDLDSIVALNHSFHIDVPEFLWDLPPWVRSEIRQKHFYVSEDDVGGITGAVSLIPHMDMLILETIAVRDDCRGKGLGRQLIEFSKEYAATRKYRQLLVGSFCEYGLRPFYEGCGFTYEGTEECIGLQAHQFYMDVPTGSTRGVP